MSVQNSIDGPENLSATEREALEALLFRLADDELVIGERYQDWIVKAPTLESDLSLANVTQDEFGHARLWYTVLKDLGYEESDLIYERDPNDFANATLVELAFADGDWADVVVRGFLYDQAEAVRLRTMTDSTYAPLADRVPKVLREEEYHRDYSQNWLVQLTSEEQGRSRVQAAVDRLVPYALTLFEGDTDVDETIVDAGFRNEPLSALRNEWLDIVALSLETYGISVPDVAHLEASMPDAIGRDGTHTADWVDLHDEMTLAYRRLGRDDTERVMDDPE
jgi:ring-1,2-phenylacetyl-CoA epoxidase subunit PaaC